MVTQTFTKMDGNSVTVLAKLKQSTSLWKVTASGTNQREKTPLDTRHLWEYAKQRILSGPMPKSQTMKPPAQLSLPESGTRADFKAAVMEKLAVWGIYDTRDKCWMGTANGPLTYQDDMMARAAVTIMNMRFGTTTRFRKLPMWETDLICKDTVTPPLSAVEAMQQNNC